MSKRDRATVFCVHYLGGSGREWSGVAAFLDGMDCVTIDLPGFGDQARRRGYAVGEMADHVAASIRAAACGRWLLAGHSMGAKVAACVARRAEDGEAGLDGLAGLVLLAGSPPGPEPMPESRRREMLGWFAGDAAGSRAEAARFIARNVGAPLEPGLHRQAVEDVLRADPAAWTAWLEQGSREDWSARIDVLRTPALLIAGGEDADLGAAAQQAIAGRHFADAQLVVLPGAGHLLPVERPEAVARLIAQHAAALLVPEGVDPAYWRLVHSDRVSARTRDALVARAAPDDPDYAPAALTESDLTLLRAVVDRVLPQGGAVRIDLAARIDAMLATGTGDGWRFDLLPPDPLAYRAGLRTIQALALASHGAPFAALDGARQDALLQQVAAGDAGLHLGLLDARQMRLWFEEVRADAVKLYVGHPATLSRMGYGGIAYGGDGEPKPGFVHIGAGEREAWEPTGSHVREALS